jgi:hypothetical protein
VDPNAGSLEDVLIIGAFIDVLKASPAADVIDKDGGKRYAMLLNVFQKLIQALSAGEVRPAPAMVGVHLHDLHVVARGVLAHDLQLVFGGVLLVLGRHADILGRTGRGKCFQRRTDALHERDHPHPCASSGENGTKAHRSLLSSAFRTAFPLTERVENLKILPQHPKFRGSDRTWRSKQNSLFFPVPPFEGPLNLTQNAHASTAERIARALQRLGKPQRPN